MSLHSRGSSRGHGAYTTSSSSTAASHSTSSSIASVGFPAPPNHTPHLASAAQEHIGDPSATASSPIQRRAPSTAHPDALPSPTRPVSSSETVKGSPRLAELTPRPHSLRTPTLQQGATQRFAPSLPPHADPFGITHHEHHSFTTSPSDDSHDPIDSLLASTYPPSSTYGDSRRSSIPIHSRYAHEHTLSHAPRFSISSLDFESADEPARKSSSPSAMPTATKAAPPAMKLEIDGVRRTLTDESLSSTDSANGAVPKSPGGRLGNLFGWKRSSPESPSDKSLSPQSGMQRSYSMDTGAPRANLSPPVVEIQKAGLQHRNEYFDNDETPILLGSAETNAHVKELEKELTQVSTELAGSIKREMELEDEIERIRAHTPGDASRDPTERGSDYFSDSGTSASPFSTSDPESKVGQLEHKLRKAEQEKAQIKVEMASRLQTELSRRRDLEIMVHKLEEQFQAKMDEEEQRGDAEERVDELETTLEDTRRLLSQERQAKASFEDLYTATKGELERHVNQQSRMQQELAALKGGGNTRFGSIAEEDGKGGLTRSGSLARSASRRGGSMSRSGDRPDGPRQRSGSTSGLMSLEGVKDIEDQRDALHKALKLLIIRSEKQQKDHELAIRKLTNAKTKVERSTPSRSAYHREVSFLKEEVATLRKRTEDALEQKWQYEKGLSGIKMDLDRAELETRGLRIILQEHDILGSSSKTLFGTGQEGEGADAQLEQSISSAESERDQARQVAQEYRQRAQSVQDGSSAELNRCAQRMDELADQLEKQVQSNIELRGKLANAVARGEREQRESNGKIGEMQKRLASMEDSVLAAQQHSETTLGTHEAEVRKLEEASAPALQRLRLSASLNPNRLTPTSPLISGGRSPKVLGKKLSDNSLLEMSKTQMLERKVKELEALLREAEEDMQDVVQKVNSSQLEVAELQTERDAAFSQMRKLQAMIVQEREKAEGLMN